MADRKSAHTEGLLVEDDSVIDLFKFYGYLAFVRMYDLDAVKQVMNSLKRIFAAMDGDLLDRFPP